MGSLRGHQMYSLPQSSQKNRLYEAKVGPYIHSDCVPSGLGSEDIKMCMKVVYYNKR